ncbi:heterokaryon incompatibility protein-domain-containing protein [Amylocystis lapponica]|nr:heterokaryon incompatibility protein-domain-containing protein [Amylocystis lapponica]
MDGAFRYIQNHLPKRLIHLPDMKLMETTAIQEMAQSELEQRLRGRTRGPLQPSIDAVMSECYNSLGYAILSHRWLSRGEPTCQDLSTKTYTEVPEAGFIKLTRFCQLARMHGCRWAWADTCCIDKTSSAELDESIRSMYQWYENAKICIVYLGNTEHLSGAVADPWFTRAWTLQELLAPKRIKFFNKHWMPLTADDNDKAIDSLILRDIAKITDIPPRFIRHFTPGTDMVLEKMAWASSRKATRVEDMAYSLVGIFDVSLTIAYGEGERAFYRLQLAIMEKSPAVDLLVWSGRASKDNTMIASSPKCFIDSPRQLDDLIDFMITPDPLFGENISIRIWRGSQSHAMTSAGLRLDVVMYDVSVSHDNTFNFANRYGEPMVIDHIDKNPVILRCAHLPSRAYTVAIIDYEWDDAADSTSNSFGALIQQSAYHCTLDFGLAYAIENRHFQRRKRRLYTGVLLNRINEAGRLLRFQRVASEKYFRVRRPENGWKKPETVYII